MIIPSKKLKTKTTTFKKTALVSTISMILPFSTMATDFIVTEATDDGSGLITNSLSWAILQANMNMGDDIITLNTDVTITGVMKRIMDSNITLHSDSIRRTIDGNNSFRPLFIKSGNVVIENINIINSKAQGGAENRAGRGAGMGGSLFIYDGTVYINTVNFSNSSALSAESQATLYSGGGGMFGNSTTRGGGGLFADAIGNSGGYAGYDNYRNNDPNFGMGGSFNSANISGGFGGGGSYGYTQPAGNGGFGGGGGEGYYNDGGDGGFGAGGGFSTYTASGVAGYGADGANSAAMGGAIFIRSGDVTLAEVSIENSQSQAALTGKGLGGALFIMHTSSNSNGNDQGMPASLPTVSVCELTFSNNSASDDTGVINNNDDIFDLADILIDEGICILDEIIFQNGFEQVAPFAASSLITKTSDDIAMAIDTDGIKFDQ